ncbi:MAG: hypothetical protein H6667_25815 [Ardenticatenaceae bacterium]|nr:hypothetical protein [Ardenticatenaceae bacterium]MCB9445479.1 hypothetical protein [Ardenticatenaceae bacterium]
MEANELIDRYVHEVGGHLPRRMREDIQLELSSLVNDALDERASAAGKEPTVEMAADVLRQMGKPEDMAASYLPEQYLIGPHLFPVYKLVLIIVLVVLGGFFLLAAGFSLFDSEPGEIGRQLWELVSGFWTTLLTNFALITLIFAVIEAATRYKKDIKVVTPADLEDWDPYKLPQAQDPDRVKRGELIASIVFTILVIILFNVYPHWIGVISFRDGEGPYFFPFLAPEFAVHIPWLTMLWVTDVVLKLVVLAQGRWNKPTRWVEFGLGFFGLYVGYRIVTGGPITAFTWLDVLVRFGIWIGLIVGAFESLGRLFKLVWGRPFITTKNIKSRLA